MVLFRYTDDQGILLGSGQSRYEPWGSSFRGLVFRLVCRFHSYWAMAHSPVWPRMESCFQDGALSVSSFISTNGSA